MKRLVYSMFVQRVQDQTGVFLEPEIEEPGFMYSIVLAPLYCSEVAHQRRDCCSGVVRDYDSNFRLNEIHAHHLTWTLPVSSIPGRPDADWQPISSSQALGNSGHLLQIIVDEVHGQS